MKRGNESSLDDSNISTRQLLRGGEKGGGHPSGSHSKNNIHPAGIKAGLQNNTARKKKGPENVDQKQTH